MYEIILPEKVRTQLKKLDKITQKRVISVLERIRIKPEHYVTKLIGDPAYKLRIGDYRIILDIDKDKITIIKVGHRKNIYDF